MERDLAMNRARAALLVLLTFVYAATAAQDTTVRSLILVTRADSTLAPLTPSEVRQLFLGIPVMKDGVRLQPLRNESDPRLYEVFLQKAMFMSADHYERLLLGRVFRSGDRKPPAFHDRTALMGALQATPIPVSFAWDRDLRGHAGVRPLQHLWRGPVDE